MQGKTLSAVFALNDKYTMTMRKIIQSTDDYEKKLKRAEKATSAFEKQTGNIKSSAEKGTSGINSMIGQLGSLISTAYLAKKALDLTFSAIKTSALQKVQETTFGALVGDKQVGSDVYDYISEYAKTSALGREDVAKGTTTFLTVTRNIEEVEQLIKMTERLYAKDPSQGAEGAVFALKEALAGDTISLRNRYGITGLSGESLRAGDTTSKIEQIDKALNQFGATQEVVDANFDNILTQAGIFATNLTTSIGEKAQPIMETLSLTVQRLNADMQAGKYEPFMNVMVKGMELIGNGLAFVAENANWLVPVVAGVVSAIVAYNVVTAVAAFLTNALAQNWIGVAAIGVGVAATIATMSIAMGEVEQKSANTASNLADVKKKAGAGLAGTTIPVEVSNSAPIKVTGEVDIDREDMKMMLDMAGQKYFAQYSHNETTLVPQQQIVMNVQETADADKVLDMVAKGLKDMKEIQPNGVYSQ